MTKIEHLFIASGGPIMFYGYNVLYNLIKTNKLNIKKLKSVHGTSSGSIIAALLLLKLDNDYLFNYISNFNWSEVINLFKLLNKGIFNLKLLNKFLNPLLEKSNMNKNITLEEFYKITNIEYNAYTVNISSGDFKEEVLNYKTYPDMTLKKAILCSSYIPIISDIVSYNKNYYIDGGFKDNLSLKYYIENTYNINLNSENIDDFFNNISKNTLNKCLIIDYKYKGYSDEYSFKDSDNFILSSLNISKTIFNILLRNNKCNINSRYLQKYFNNYIMLDLTNYETKWDKLFNNEVAKDILNKYNNNIKIELI